MAHCFYMNIPVKVSNKEAEALTALVNKEVEIKNKTYFNTVPIFLYL